jgi:hypothetical protein
MMVIGNHFELGLLPTLALSSKHRCKRYVYRKSWVAFGWGVAFKSGRQFWKSLPRESCLYELKLRPDVEVGLCSTLSIYFILSLNPTVINGHRHSVIFWRTSWALWSTNEWQFRKCAHSNANPCRSEDYRLIDNHQGTRTYLGVLICVLLWSNEYFSHITDVWAACYRDGKGSCI